MVSPVLAQNPENLCRGVPLHGNYFSHVITVMALSNQDENPEMGDVAEFVPGATQLKVKVVKV